jgi:ribosomal protein S18 acetylase RimI-like enzyme
MVSIRIAAIEDIEQISRVLAASWKTAYRGIVNDDYLDSLADNHWVDFLTVGLNGGSVFAMVLQNGQEIIGASILSKSKKKGEVHLISLYLVPDKIGQGLGCIFYHEIEKEMVKRGFAKCVLDVLENNQRAIRFYKSHDYIGTDTETPVTLGEQSYVCKVFEKVLS